MLFLGMIVVVEKRYFFILLGAILLAGGIFLVNAYNSGGPPSTFGHSSEEIEIDEVDPTVLEEVKDGIDWEEVSSRPSFSCSSGKAIRILNLDDNTRTCINVGGGGAQTAEGTYTGNGPGNTKSFNLGFRPSTVMIIGPPIGGEAGVDYWYMKTDSMSGWINAFFGADTPGSSWKSHGIDIDSNGFNVRLGLNELNIQYYYTAYE